MFLRFLSATLLAGSSLIVVAGAAQGQSLPAVSGPNAKVSLDGGSLYIPAIGQGVIVGIDGSVSLPLGDSVGIQVDGMANMFMSSLTAGGAVHVFTRDPAQGLIGLTGAAVRGHDTTLAAFGPEGELYFGQGSLEVWAGWAMADYLFNPDVSGFFAMGDLAFYPTPDFRLALGASSVLGYESLHIGLEYQFGDAGMPLTVTGDGRLGEDGAASFRIGIRGYLGDDKTLVDRHRQDDPRNRSVDLWGGAGSAAFDETDPCVIDPESCVF